MNCAENQLCIPKRCLILTACAFIIISKGLVLRIAEKKCTVYFLRRTKIHAYLYIFLLYYIGIYL